MPLFGVDAKHYGPGKHPGTGTPQSVHGDDASAGNSAARFLNQRLDPEWRPVLKIVLDQYRLPQDSIHGPAHWLRVLTNGLALAEETGADRMVVQGFAILHDSQRINEDYDTDHGPQAARYVKQLADAGKLPNLTPMQLTLLLRAVGQHTLEITQVNPTLKTCLDADRLDLGRAGVWITPDPKRLYTPEGRDMIPEAMQRSRADMDDEAVWLPAEKHYGPGPHPSGSSQAVHGKIRTGLLARRSRELYRWCNLGEIISLSGSQRAASLDTTADPDLYFAPPKEQGIGSGRTAKVYLRAVLDRTKLAAAGWQEWGRGFEAERLWRQGPKAAHLPEGETIRAYRDAITGIEIHDAGEMDVQHVADIIRHRLERDVRVSDATTTKHNWHGPTSEPFDEKHYGPGPHPGTFTPQSVHAGRGKGRDPAGQSGKPFWQMTLAEFSDPYPKAPEGWEILYHVTRADPAVIRREGLLREKASGYEAPRDMLWATVGPFDYSEANPLVVFKVPKDDPRVKYGNSTDRMITRSIPPEDILAVFDYVRFPKQIERQQRIIPLRANEYYREDRMRFRVGKTAHRMYVEDALQDGRPVPEEVLADYPDLKEKYGKKTGPGRGYWHLPGAPHVGPKPGQKGSQPRGTKHYGPGRHPGTGTPQSVHGGGEVAATDDLHAPRRKPLPTAGQLPLLEAVPTVPAVPATGRRTWRTTDELAEIVLNDAGLTDAAMKIRDSRERAAAIASEIQALYRLFGPNPRPQDEVAKIQGRIDALKEELDEIIGTIDESEMHIITTMSDLLRGDDPLDYRIIFSDDSDYPFSDMTDDPVERERAEEHLKQVLTAVISAVDKEALSEFESATNRRQRNVRVALMNIGGGSWYTQLSASRYGRKVRGAGAIHMGMAEMGSPAPLREVLIHEFGHWLDERIPALHEAVGEYFQDRTAKGRVYYDTMRRQYGREDHFIDDYMERFYPSTNFDGDFDEMHTYSTEVPSTALAMLFSDPVRLASIDEALFKIIVRAITGLE